MQLTKEQKEEIVIQLASWLPPKEIEKEYGISQASIYYYCNKYQIPKYRENMSNHFMLQKVILYNSLVLKTSYLMLVDTYLLVNIQF